MNKTNAALLFAAFVLPIAVQAAYLPLTEPLHHSQIELWQVDLALYFASLASGVTCLLILTARRDVIIRVVIVCFYCFLFGYFLFVVRTAMCRAFLWRDDYLTL